MKSQRSERFLEVRRVVFNEGSEPLVETGLDDLREFWFEKGREDALEEIKEKRRKK